MSVIPEWNRMPDGTPIKTYGPDYIPPKFDPRAAQNQSQLFMLKQSAEYSEYLRQKAEREHPGADIYIPSGDIIFAQRLASVPVSERFKSITREYQKKHFANVSSTGTMYPTGPGGTYVWASGRADMIGKRFEADTLTKYQEQALAKVAGTGTPTVERYLAVRGLETMNTGILASKIESGSRGIGLHDTEISRRVASLLSNPIARQPYEKYYWGTSKEGATARTAMGATFVGRGEKPLHQMIPGSVNERFGFDEYGKVLKPGQRFEPAYSNVGVPYNPKMGHGDYVYVGEYHYAETGETVSRYYEKNVGSFIDVNKMGVMGPSLTAVRSGGGPGSYYFTNRPDLLTARDYTRGGVLRYSEPVATVAAASAGASAISDAAKRWSNIFGNVGVVSPAKENRFENLVSELPGTISRELSKGVFDFATGVNVGIIQQVPVFADINKAGRIFALDHEVMERTKNLPGEISGYESKVKAYTEDLNKYSLESAPPGGVTESRYNELMSRREGLVREQEDINTRVADITALQNQSDIYKRQLTAGDPRLNAMLNRPGEMIDIHGWAEGIGGFVGGMARGYEDLFGGRVKGFIDEQYNNPDEMAMAWQGRGRETEKSFAGDVAVSASKTLVDVPKTTLEFLEMLPVGAVTLARNPATLPALAAAGLAMQAQGIYEGLTTRPVEFAIEQGGTMVMLHGMTGMAKYGAARVPVGVGIGRFEVPVGFKYDEFGRILRDKANNPVYAMESYRSIYFDYRRRVDLPFGRSIGSFYSGKIPLVAARLAEGEWRPSGWAFGRGASERLFANTRIPEVEIDILSERVQMATAYEKLGAFRHQMAPGHVDLMEAFLGSRDIISSTRNLIKLERGFGENVPSRISPQAYARVIEYINKNEKDFASYGSTVADAYLGKYGRQTLGDIDALIRAGVTEQHAVNLFRIVAEDVIPASERTAGFIERRVSQKMWKGESGEYQPYEEVSWYAKNKKGEDILVLDVRGSQITGTRLNVHFVGESKFILDLHPAKAAWPWKDRLPGRYGTATIPIGDLFWGKQTIGNPPIGTIRFGKSGLSEVVIAADRVKDYFDTFAITRKAAADAWLDRGVQRWKAQALEQYAQTFETNLIRVAKENPELRQFYAEAANPLAEAAVLDAKYWKMITPTTGERIGAAIRSPSTYAAAGGIVGGVVAGNLLFHMPLTPEFGSQLLAKMAAGAGETARMAWESGIAKVVVTGVVFPWMKGGKGLKFGEARLTPGELDLYKGMLKGGEEWARERARVETLEGEMIDWEIGATGETAQYSKNFLRMFVKGKEFDYTGFERVVRDKVATHTHPMHAHGLDVLGKGYEEFGLTPSAADIRGMYWAPAEQSNIITRAGVTVMQLAPEAKLLSHAARIELFESGMREGINVRIPRGVGGKIFQDVLGEYGLSRENIPKTLAEAEVLPEEIRNAYGRAMSRMSMVQFAHMAGKTEMGVSFIKDIDVKTGIGKVYGFDPTILRLAGMVEKEIASRGIEGGSGARGMRTVWGREMFRGRGVYVPEAEFPDLFKSIPGGKFGKVEEGISTISLHNQPIPSDFVVESFESDFGFLHGMTQSYRGNRIYAVEGNKIVGGINYSVKGGMIALDTIEVAVPGKGVGTALVSRLLSDARERGITYIHGNARMENVAFSEKLGFSRTGDVYTGELGAMVEIEYNLKSPSMGKVLELGPRNAPGASTTHAIELSGKDLIEVYNEKGIDLIGYDFTKPFRARNNYFDSVVASRPDVALYGRNTLGEIYRVLKPGGVFEISEQVNLEKLVRENNYHATKLLNDIRAQGFDVTVGGEFGNKIFAEKSLHGASRIEEDYYGKFAKTPGYDFSYAAGVSEAARRGERIYHVKVDAYNYSARLSELHYRLGVAHAPSGVPSAIRTYDVKSALYAPMAYVVPAYAPATTTTYAPTVSAAPYSFTPPVAPYVPVSPYTFVSPPEAPYVIPPVEVPYLVPPPPVPGTPYGFEMPPYKPPTYPPYRPPKPPILLWPEKKKRRWRLKKKAPANEWFIWNPVPTMETTFGTQLNIKALFPREKQPEYLYPGMKKVSLFPKVAKNVYRYPKFRLA